MFLHQLLWLSVTTPSSCHTIVKNTLMKKVTHQCRDSLNEDAPGPVRTHWKHDAEEPSSLNCIITINSHRRLTPFNTSQINRNYRLTRPIRMSSVHRIVAICFIVLRIAYLCHVHALCHLATTTTTTCQSKTHSANTLNKHYF
jgi:hypothetical protein